MALNPGTRIGSYEITAQIGVGGMGEVYRATDTNLARKVAVKVLPEAVASDAERLARFDREAKTLAALNHPNIAHIYGLERAEGQTALVMELVEGPTLADRIAEGPIPVGEALAIAKQIAEALEAAHEQGIIHRDLKPANVKVRPDGTVKVLDFGLAKAMEPVGVMSSSQSMSPTITTPAMTQAGMILGTAAYMSPEQAKGRGTDRRSDIWAFGAVLYEMLTGRRAFDGEEVTEVLASVIKEQVNLSLLPADSGPDIPRIIRRCLERNIRRRFQDIGDVRVELEDALGPVDQAPKGSTAAGRRSSWSATALGTLGGALVTGAIAGMAWWLASTAPSDEHPVRRYSLVLPAARTLTLSQGRMVALSPDGRTLVYRAEEDGNFRLYQRRLDSFETTVIPGSDGVEGELLVFSPDSRSLAFRVGPNLMRVQLSGGQPVRVAQIPAITREASWETDNSIVIALRDRSGLLQVPIDGGEPTSMPIPDQLAAQGVAQYWYPQSLEGGRAFLVTAASMLAPDAGSLVIIDKATGETSTIMASATAGYVLPTGYLVFVRGSDLWAARFDLASMKVLGDPTVVLQGIRVEGGGAVQIAMAADGTVAYVPGLRSDRRRYQLTWVDRDGNEEAVGPPGAYDHLRLSPDDTRVAVSALSEGNWDIWILDLLRGGATRLTTDPGIEQGPIWSTDGTQVFFSILRSGSGVSRKPANGTGVDEPLLSGEPDIRIWPVAETQEGSLIIGDSPQGIWRISMLTLGDELSRSSLIEETFGVQRPALSPDGSWIAYDSPETGRAEVYVRPFPDVEGGRLQVSTNGGLNPVWSRAGERLFFLEAGKLVSVDMETKPALRAGSPRLALDGDYALTERAWDVSNDGERFLVRKDVTPGAGDSSERAPAEINVIVNFTEELNRLLPAE